MPPLAAVASALDIVRASIAFAPADNDVPKASRYLRRYYEKARRSAGLQADARTLSDLEMRYWVVHRSSPWTESGSRTRTTSDRWSRR